MNLSFRVTTTSKHNRTAMTEKFRKVYEKTKSELLDYLKEILKGKKNIRVNKPIQMIRYNYDYFSDFLVTYKLKRVFVEDNNILIEIEDEDGDCDESYLKDESLDTVIRIILLIEALDN